MPDGKEWSLDEKLKMIVNAGFDGVGVRFAERGLVKPVTDFMRAYGKTWQAQAYPKTVDDIKPILDHVLEFGADHINVQADVRPYRLEDCFPLIEGWLRLANDAGVQLHFETHRNRITNDMMLTLQLLDHYPQLRLTGDLSHYVMGREVWHPLTKSDEDLFQRILARCWGFHGRVASREQIQLQLNFPQHQHWVALFKRWWADGFKQWRARASSNATLTFLCELGPREYAMTGADGYELSDRWQESLLMQAWAREIWDDAILCASPHPMKDEA